MWMVTVLVFGIFFVGPGPDSVARRIAGKNATPQTVELIRARLHLNQPIVVQYWDFLKQLVWHHNLGYSYYHQQPVTTVLKQAFPITFSLAIGAAIIWLVLGVLSGVLSAVRRGSVWDRSATTWPCSSTRCRRSSSGLLLLWLFYYQFTIHGHHVVPRARGTRTSPRVPLKWFRGLVLPWITLALVSAAAYTRLTRGSLLEVLGEDYIRTARSKGLTERRVIYRHGLRSALTPVVSQFGIDLGVLLGGAIITETGLRHAGPGLDRGQRHRITGPAGDHRDRDRRRRPRW